MKVKRINSFRFVRKIRIFWYGINKAKVRRNSQFGGIKTLGKDTMRYFSLCKEKKSVFQSSGEKTSFRKAPRALKNKPGDSLNVDV